jgi:hypothetical protein
VADVSKLAGLLLRTAAGDEEDGAPDVPDEEAEAAERPEGERANPTGRRPPKSKKKPAKAARPLQRPNKVNKRTFAQFQQLVDDAPAAKRRRTVAKSAVGKGAPTAPPSAADGDS